MASIYDLYIEQGSDFSQSLNLTGDFTGVLLQSTIKDSSGEIAVDFVDWTDESEGELEISLTASETEALSQGVGYYNIETNTGGVIDRILQGRIYVDGEVK